MNARLFGWKPLPGSLATPHGCDAAIVELKAQKARVNLAMQQRRPNEHAPYAEEMGRLEALRRDIIDQRQQLLDVTSGEAERFNKTFRRVVEERVGSAVFRDLVNEANRRIAAADAQPSTARGPVLEPRAGGGGMRRRA